MMPRMTQADAPGATRLPPLLGAAFPPVRLPPEEVALLQRVQATIDAEIAPNAEAVDRAGRYPTAAIAALKRTGALAAGVPKALGGPGTSHRFSLEVQLRLAAADPSVAQIFKVHDELVREVLAYCPDEVRSWLAGQVVNERAILGVAVAEPGKRVDAPWQSVVLPQPGGGFVLNGHKVYTTGAAEADWIAVWAFNPTVPGIEHNFLLGCQLSLVPRDAAGVTVHRDWDNLGQRATDSGSLSLQGVEVPAGRVASVSGKAPLPHQAVRYQAGFAAVLLGIAVGALRAAVPFIADVSRPWPSSGAERASDDPYVRRLTGELVSELAAAYALTLATGDLLDDFEAGTISRTELAVPIYAARTTATRAALRTTHEMFALMGTRATHRQRGLDRFWRDARTLSLHDPIEWKHAEIGQHVLTGWDPPPGIYT